MRTTRAKQQAEIEANATISRYSEAVRLNPNDVAAHNNLGAALAEQNRVDEAIREFAEALRIVPNNADLHFNLAAMFQRKGRTHEALEHLRKALQFNPRHEDARRLLDDLMRTPNSVQHQ